MVEPTDQGRVLMRSLAARRVLGLSPATRSGSVERPPAKQNTHTHTHTHTHASCPTHRLSKPRAPMERFTLAHSCERARPRAICFASTQTVLDQTFEFCAVTKAVPYRHLQHWFWDWPSAHRVALQLLCAQQRPRQLFLVRSPRQVKRPLHALHSLRKRHP